MRRKRLTQWFPQLLPLRKKQRIFCFYMGMRMDKERYGSVRETERYRHILFSSRCPMYNADTGFDMIYQENKVHNLKLAAARLDGMLIRPGETFSFWKTVRHADREIPYRDALATVNGRLMAVPGGGLCQLTNLLFWVFLHSPLTVTERHGHQVKDFPEPESDAPCGVDAAVAEGWKDLKVRNETPYSFQIGISFDETGVTGTLYMREEPDFAWQIENGEVRYLRQQGQVWEEAEVILKTVSRRDGAVQEKRLLYTNRCKIGYALPDRTKIETIQPDFAHVLPGQDE